MANATIKSWSKYFFDLPPGSEVKKHREPKMSLAGFSEDPYCRLETKGKGSSAVVSVEWTNWPDISWPDTRGPTLQKIVYEISKSFDFIEIL